MAAVAATGTLSAANDQAGRHEDGDGQNELAHALLLSVVGTVRDGPRIGL